MITPFSKAVSSSCSKLVVIATISWFVIGCNRPNPSPPAPTPSSAIPASPTKPASDVAEIVFEDQEVSDATIQTWLSNSALKRLRIAGSKISDVQLEQLAARTKLEVLDVTRCELVGPPGIEAIGRMTSLRNLKVSGTVVTNDTVKAFSTLSNLSALSLQQTAVTDEGLSVLHSLQKIKELNLYGSPVTDESLTTIAVMPALQKLRLRGTSVTGANFDVISKMSALSDLDLSETSFTSTGLAAVAKLPNLRSLNLWLTKVDDEGIAFLSTQTKLTLLNLDNVSGVTDRSLDTITTMKDLELLHLGGTSVTAAGLPKLYGLKNLKTLFITRLNLDPAAVATLREAMPWITKLES